MFEVVDVEVDVVIGDDVGDEIDVDVIDVDEFDVDVVDVDVDSVDARVGDGGAVDDADDNVGVDCASRTSS